MRPPCSVCGRWRRVHGDHNRPVRLRCDVISEGIRPASPHDNGHVTPITALNETIYKTRINYDGNNSPP
jgi:hypothetical protein